ncbi:MAG: alanine--tRNA ligase [Lachnospiraceae bacterium]|nr:alanine--tRNA ligase [Lachnospiraceae bacterium]
MKKYGVNELRKMFLEFFESKEHLILKSFSLVPQNDNSLLLINSGMAPLKPYFTGAELPPRKRVTTCQKCIRTGDLENVGKTARHGTFFEMLGNFSFGDYFKQDSIRWSWEFLTKVVGLDSERLYPSVYLEDDESFKIWREEIDVAPERIFKFGKEDNFWEHGSGPCGSCSEIYYDRGEKYGCGQPGCTVGCKCDRYMEIWNNVFTQFDNDGEGHYTELKQKNIDTGMGLERLAVIVQDVDSIFDVNTIQTLRNQVCEMAGLEYRHDHESDVSIRLISDHIRSTTFMLSDGIMPTNEGRGYVLRRLIRRATRHGRLLGISHLFLAELAGAFIEESKDAYPELEDKKDFIFNLFDNEEKQFNKTIDQGLLLLSDMERKMNENGGKCLSGEYAFKLYDTYGFPVDLTKEILKEKSYDIDEAGFKACMKEQQERARKARETMNYMGAEETVYDKIDPSVTTDFIGYDCLEGTSKIIVLTSETELRDSLMEGERGTIIVGKTPFYATMGGEQGDFGEIETANGVFAVEDTIKLRGGKYGHVGRMKFGMISKGEQSLLKVNQPSRKNTAKNHSATHLLQKALKIVLGGHVEQKGSLVAPNRLRFDFSHFQAMTKEELQATEDLVNQKIAEQLPVHMDIMSYDEAKQTDAIMLFEKKYGNEVRVVSMGDFSKELCGGNHVRNTGDVMLFKIISESGKAAGIRRIEALTGHGVIEYYQREEDQLYKAVKALKSSPEDLLYKIEHLQAELKSLHSENESLKSKIVSKLIDDMMANVTDIKGIHLLAAVVPNVDMNSLCDLGDQLKARLGEGVIVLFSFKEEKVNLMAMVTEEAQKAGAHAGNLVKVVAEVLGGRGGGRPSMAQAGGKNPTKISVAVKKIPEILSAQLQICKEKIKIS